MDRFQPLFIEFDKLKQISGAMRNPSNSQIVVKQLDNIQTELGQGRKHYNFSIQF